MATAVAACAELEKLPLSFKAVQKILSNLVNKPNEPKYRRLRLENKAVKELIDLEPVLNILTSVGFVRKQCDRPSLENSETLKNPKEEVLILEDSVPIELVNDFLDVLDGMTNVSDNPCKENEDTSNNSNSKEEKATVDCGKRKRDDDTASKGE